MNAATSREASLDLAPVTHASGTIALPGSKSISNRALLLAAMATGPTRLRGLLDADDVDRMLDALAILGVRVDRDATISLQPVVTLSTYDCMIDSSKSSFESISRYTAPVLTPAAAATSRTVVSS